MSSDGTVIEANTEVASRLGIRRDDVLGANMCQYLDSLIAPVPDSSGAVKRRAILGVDLPDHEKATLRQSEGKSRGLVENANDIIYTLALDGNFTYVSPDVTARRGCESPEVFGSHYTDFAHPEDIPACDASKR